MIRPVLLVALPALAVPHPVATVKTGLQPCGGVAASGGVWVADYGSSNLVRIDPRTNHVTARISVGASPCGLIAAAGGSGAKGKAPAPGGAAVRGGGRGGGGIR